MREAGVEIIGGEREMFEAKLSSRTSGRQSFAGFFARNNVTAQVLS